MCYRCFFIRIEGQQPLADKDGWSTNDFRKLQSCGHKKSLRLADLPKIWQFADPFVFAICGDTFLQVRKYIISLVINALIRTRTKLTIKPNKPVAVFMWFCHKRAEKMPNVF